MRFAPLAVSAVFGWEPGIGDPTLIGWFTTLAYLWASYACLRAHRSALVRHGGVTRLASAWLLLCIAMLVLGINKELDLQTLFTAIGRHLAHSEGWYERRRMVEYWFVRALAVASVTSGALGAWLMWRHWRELWLAALGCVLLATFVLIRAAFFYRISMLLDDTVLGSSLSWLFELGGIACVGGGASRHVHRR